MPFLLQVSGQVTNPTLYNLAVQEASLTAGQWETKPRPIPAGADRLVAFQAGSAPGTATGAVGTVTYAVSGGGAPAGTFTLTFSDSLAGENTAGWSSTVPGLSAVCEHPRSGSDITITWTLSTP
jgi:hypothetical protein